MFRRADSLGSFVFLELMIGMDEVFAGRSILSGCFFCLDGLNGSARAWFEFITVSSEIITASDKFITGTSKFITATVVFITGTGKFITVTGHFNLKKYLCSKVP